jgi:hypothetical protein
MSDLEQLRSSAFSYYAYSAIDGMRSKAYRLLDIRIEVLDLNAENIKRNLYSVGEHSNRSFLLVPNYP